MNQYNDYVIVVRTYKRYQMFIEMTYAMLIYNNIDVEKRLFIVVASEEEKELYKESLGDRKYAGFIVAEVGGHKAIEYAHNYFPTAKPIVFMDDDLEYFFEFTGKPDKSNFIKNSDSLERYILDGFDTLNRINHTIFTFSFYKNDFYIKDKPFKQFRPYNIPGGFFGVFNQHLIVTDHAHLDDIHRTCKFIHAEGGVLIYNWCGFETNTGGNEGGMQASGDRGTDETRMQYMKEMCEKIYEIPYVKKYCKEPKVAHTGMWELKLKSITSIKKLRDYDPYIWNTYFQKDYSVHENKVSLNEFV